MRHLLTILAFAAFATGAHAQQTRYVTDEVRLEARTGPSVENRIVSMLPSGTAIDVLEDREGWSRIALPGGEEAWMLTRFLTAEPPARRALATARADVEKLRMENEALIDQLQTWRSQSEELRRSRDELARTGNATAAELAELQETAAAAIATRDENDRLKRSLRELQTAHNEAARAITILQASRDRDWFVAGAGVLIGGMILGIVIPKIRWQRKKSWGEL